MTLPDLLIIEMVSTTGILAEYLECYSRKQRPAFVVENVREVSCGEVVLSNLETAVFQYFANELEMTVEP